MKADYTYFALCHNCQKWHLPMPCREELVQCGGCMQFGHAQEYCALNPTPSMVFTTSMSNFISHDLTVGNAQWIMHNAALADEIYKIKMGAVTDTLQLLAGRNREEVRAHLANAYRGLARPSASTSYHPVATQSSVSKQLPTPAFARAEIDYGLPLPNIPQAQVHDQSYEDYNTLAPLQLQSDRKSYQHTAHVVNLHDPSTSAKNHGSDTAPGVQEAPADSQAIFNFRTYDANGDPSQVGVGGDSSGDVNFTPRSSPCDDRAKSVESRDETEQEREFYEGGLY
ncbi:hypothetical protein E4T51_04285 [Aureobasidium sp. EXF-12344]|nr:hypothetical protein E4T51_04285 [Aureobasidium sp. EXF-12344]